MAVKIIAELSANHNQNIENAKESIRVAKECGADAIKLQTYTPDTMTIDCDNKYFKINHGTLWDGNTLYDLYKTAYTPWEWHKELFDLAKEVGIEIFSTPFDKSAVDLLESLDNPIYKVASFEITDIPLIEYIASKGKPVIISVGIATAEEISDAVEACKKVGNNDITLLQCTSAYPAKKEDANLSNMLELKNKFGVKIGLSDHSIGNEVSLLAAAMGAEIIEKHFIIDKKIGGPDAEFSMEKDDLISLVKEIRITEKIIGTPNLGMTENKKNSRVFARSLFVVEDLKNGDLITEKNVRSIRPGDGLAPKYLPEILGKKVNCDLKRGTPLKFDYID